MDEQTAPIAEPAKKDRSLGLYLLFSFGLSWLILLAIWLSGAYLLPYGAYFLTACMFMPALSVLLVKLIGRRGWQLTGFRPRFSHRRWLYYIIGAGLPALLSMVGTAAYFLLRPQEYNADMWAAIAPQLPLLVGTLLAAPLINLIPCTGEELGWRGFMLPQLLKRYSPRQTLLLSGLIWGLWHAPMIALGHNYGTDYPGWPWLGIFAMCLFCFFIGSILSWLTIRSNSFWPAALAHGSLNGSASLGMVFFATSATANPFVGPVATGYLGGCGFIIVGLICFVLVKGKPAQTTAGQE